MELLRTNKILHWYSFSRKEGCLGCCLILAKNEQEGLTLIEEMKILPSEPYDSIICFQIPTQEIPLNTFFTPKQLKKLGYKPVQLPIYKDNDSLSEN